MVNATALARRRSVPEPNTGCWLWLGALSTSGYAKANINGRVEYLTRALLGLRPRDGLYARHKCNTPACVNPDHIHSGTAQDNVDDARALGRHGHSIKTRCKQGHPFSGDNLAVVSEGSVRHRRCRICMRAAYLRGKDRYNANRRAKRLTNG